MTLLSENTIAPPPPAVLLENFNNEYPENMMSVFWEVHIAAAAVESVKVYDTVLELNETSALSLNIILDESDVKTPQYRAVLLLEITFDLPVNIMLECKNESMAAPKSAMLL